MCAFIIGININKNNERLIIKTLYQLSDQESIKFMNIIVGIETFVVFTLAIIKIKIYSYAYHLEQNVNNHPVVLGHFLSAYALA